MLRRILLVFIEPELRDKIIKILLLLFVARLLAQIPIPILRPADISPLIDSDAVLGLLNVIAGGAFGRLSFVMLGIGPYISASIVIQLLAVLIPSLSELQKEGGNAARQKITQWTRYLTIPLAALQSWTILQYLSADDLQGQIQLPEELSSSVLSWQSFGYWSIVVASMTAGSIIMMWIAELISEFKLGDGTSIIMLTGIVARLPDQTIELFRNVQPTFNDLFTKFTFEKALNLEVWKALIYGNPVWEPVRLTFLLVSVFILTLFFVVFIYSAIRNVPIVYSRRGHSEGNSRTLTGLKSFMPIKVNTAGVIPIIFAVSFILFPTNVARLMSTSNVESLKKTGADIQTFLSIEPNETVLKPDNLPREIIGFFGTSNKDDLKTAQEYKPNQGAELLGFTVTSIPGTKNEFFKGTFAEFATPEVGENSLPKYSIHFRGILAYPLIYFFLIIFFTYFYTANVIFKTDDVSEKLQNWGAFIPGYRPGAETKAYLDYLSNTLNTIGSVFLAVIAIVPLFFNNRFNFGDGTLNTIVGGSTLLILVAVSIETLKQIEAQATAIDYERFTKY